jgi:TolB protein
MVGGTLYYAYRHGGYTNLWAQVLGRPNPVRLTAGPWDDRDPAINPAGTRLAFASHREGSWNLYILDLTTGDIQRLTSGPDYKGNAKWSPDGQYLVFEMYRNDNLDIGIISAKGGSIIPLTADPAADYAPAWSPAGRQIVWVSLRSGNPDLWMMSLDHPDERQYVQLTNTPDMQEANPAFSPNGDVVVYTDVASPYTVIWGHSAVDANAPAFEAGQGLYPTWSPEGSSLASVVVQESGPDYVLAAPLSQHGLSQIAFRAEAGHITGLAWSGGVLPETLPASLAPLSHVSDAPLWTEVISDTQPAGSDPPYALVPLVNITAADARLSDRVDEAFVGLRVTTARAVGWDFLNTLDNALVELDAPPPPSLDFNSWLKTGRAFDFAQAAEQFGWVKLTREDHGFHTYWRVWLLAAVQDGSEGEPLRLAPWNLVARYSGRPQPYDAGGEYSSVLPPGYFIDFSLLADDYGWSRVPAESNWRQFYPGIMYWRFEHRDGLDWLSAMREVYSAGAVATRTPVPSPTDTPTITQTRTPTVTRTRTPTRTPTATASRFPTITLSPSATRWPTITLTPSRTPRPTATPKGTWYTATPTDTPTESPPLPINTGASSQP